MSKIGKRQLAITCEDSLINLLNAEDARDFNRDGDKAGADPSHSN